MEPWDLFEELEELEFQQYLPLFQPVCKSKFKVYRTLQQAILSMDIDLLTRFLHNGTDLYGQYEFHMGMSTSRGVLVCSTTALRYAVREHRWKSVEFLLHVCENIESVDSQTIRCAFARVHRDYQESYHGLVTKLASLLTQDDISHFKYKPPVLQSLPALKYFMDRGLIDTHYRDSDGGSLLQIFDLSCCYHPKQFTEPFKMLCLRGADLNAVDNDGNTPLNTLVKKYEMLYWSSGLKNFLCPRREAIRHGALKQIAILFAFNANTEILNKKGKNFMGRHLYFENSTILISKIQRIIEEQRVARRLAFCMVTHRRIGQDSAANVLGADIVKLVWDQCKTTEGEQILQTLISYPPTTFDEPGFTF